MYGDGWPRTALRAAVVAAGHVAALGVTLAVVGMIALLSL